MKRIAGVFVNYIWKNSKTKREMLIKTFPFSLLIYLF